MTFGKELVQSAEEALAIAEGRVEPAAVYVSASIDVVAIRERLQRWQSVSVEPHSLSHDAVPARMKESGK